MPLQNAISVRTLMDHRNAAQRAVELFLCNNYPLDTEEKVATLRLLARDAAAAEHALRSFVHRGRMANEP